MKCSKTNESVLSNFYNQFDQNNDDDSSDDEFICDVETDNELS
jgi:hypothetical protein